MTKTVFFLLLGYRLLTTQIIGETFYVADEYYQSLEIAHRMVFGFGYKTWEWRVGLRSYLHPLMYAVVFWLVKAICGEQTTTEMLLFGANVLNSIQMTVLDYICYRMVSKTGNVKLSNMTLFMMISNWFVAYCGGRSLVNGTEAMFTMFALYFFVEGNDLKFWVFAGIGCILRPTNGVVYLPFILMKFQQVNQEQFFRSMLKYCFPLIILFVGLSVLIDSLMYGSFTMVIWNFLKFNVIDGRSNIYGTQPFHWYFSQGVWALLGFHAFPLLIALWNWKSLNFKWFGIIILWTMTVYSFLPHKEFRFIYPILPLLLIWGSHGLYIVSKMSKLSRLILFSTFLLPNFIFILYFGQYHQRGPISTMRFIREFYKLNEKDHMSVRFLLPCHHVPGYTHLHVSNQFPKINMKQLDCSPNFATRNEMHYVDEADRFYQDPLLFVQSIQDDPDLIIMYDKMSPVLKSWLREKGYMKLIDIENSKISLDFMDKRIGKVIHIYALV